ncbi:MAG: hypothetical protein H6734_12340 [Alphaproteobacteria bacterium]|nr:hypothetical protein [Alphaproteobacteria bacterium]
MRTTRVHTAVVLSALAVVAVVVLRCAWVSDDAFITLRTVHNALSGYGLRFNPAERVQAYTHPLWMALLLVAHAAVGSPWYAAAGLGGLVTLVGLAALAFPPTPDGERTEGAAAALALFVGSKALVDYATSGLENPLTHLLILATAVSVDRGQGSARHLARTTALVALAVLTRPDMGLLLLPLWGLHAWRAGRSGLPGVLLGAVPLVAWEAFSLVYYGALVPNTAFAKLGTGIPRLELLAQGATYLAHPFHHDPATALLLCGLPALALATPRPALRAVALGALLHLAWVGWIGGDFMAGRFLTPAAFTALVVLRSTPLPRGLPGALAALGVSLSLALPTAPLRAGPAYRGFEAHEGIVDERGFYHRGSGWLGGGVPGEGHAFARAGARAREAGKRSVTRATVGLFGYYAGPDVHIVDPLGLTEPLLARLPARYDPHWRIGHHRRPKVRGYDPVAGTPPEDPRLAALYARVVRLTRGDLLDPTRWWDGVWLQIAPPALPPLRFADALPALPGRVHVTPVGACLPVDPPRPANPVVTGEYDDTLVIVWVRGDRSEARHAQALDDGDFYPYSALQGRPKGDVDAICLYPGTKDGQQDVTVTGL